MKTEAIYASWNEDSISRDAQGITTVDALTTDRRMQRDAFASIRATAASISRADVADFKLKQLTDDSHLHKTPPVAY